MSATNWLHVSHVLWREYWPLIIFCRQYALLLSYFQYCRSILDSDVPPSVLRFLLLEEQEADDDDFILQKVLFCYITLFPFVMWLLPDHSFSLLKVLKEHNELAHGNFSIIRKEAQAIVDLVSHSFVYVKFTQFVFICARETLMTTACMPYRMVMWYHSLCHHM